MREKGHCAFNIQPRLVISQKNGILLNSNYHIGKSWININEEILEIMIVLR
jgi:hypothetical protein